LRTSQSHALSDHYSNKQSARRATTLGVDRRFSPPTCIVPLLRCSSPLNLNFAIRCSNLQSRAAVAGDRRVTLDWDCYGRAGDALPTQPVRQSPNRPITIGGLFEALPVSDLVELIPATLGGWAARARRVAWPAWPGTATVCRDRGVDRSRGPGSGPLNSQRSQDPLSTPKMLAALGPGE